MNYEYMRIINICLIFFTKIIYYSNHFFKLLFRFSSQFSYKNKLYKFNFVKDSILIHLSDSIEEIPSRIKYDYIVFKDKYMDKTIINIFDEIEQLDYLNSYPVNYSFLLILLINDMGKKYNITNILNESTHFYYNINSLILDKKFINWIFINHLRDYNIANKLKTYKISILDNNANSFEITDKNGIILRENKYEIINMK